MRRFLQPIPNILSALRLVLAGYFPFSPEQWWLWLILAGGGSDFLDGWIARNCRVESWQGGLLDAIADKLFVLSVLATFTLSGKFSPWWIPLIIARDLTVTAIAAYAALRGAWPSFREMGASRFGKLATAGQFLIFLVVLLAPGFIIPFLVLAVACSFLAAADYARQFTVALQNR